MVSLTFYGGINEIGGNKILLEDEERRLFLDFGFPYKRHKLFYEEYLKPRSSAGLLDPLAMGLLPPLEGLYRSDLETPGLWQQFRESPLYCQLDQVDGVLLSHAHLDHSGYISFLRSDIPVYATGVTAFITKAMQDSGKADFDQRVCYFSPASQECPRGWKQAAFLTSNTAKQQRQFCLADRDPVTLSPEALQFWRWGFWEKTPRQKELASCSLISHEVCSFNLRCFPVDHSIPGACAWGIKTSSGWIIYSGDLRLHGKRAELTRRFIEEAAELHPKVLIIEGTNVPRDSNVAEYEVYESGLKAIASSDSLVIADFSPRDVDRLLTFLQIAKDTGRKLVILPKDAYLLKTMRLLEPEIPDITEDNSLAIYQKTIGKAPDLWRRNICEEYSSKIVLADDVSSAQAQFILCFSFFDLNELPSIHPKPGSLYVYSSSEPHDEEQEIDFRRLHEWLKHFELKGFGLPVEIKQGDWEVPDSEKGLHASGHACGPDLLQIAGEIKPEVLIPVHSERPEFYVEHLEDREVGVVLPSLGKTIEL